MLDFLMIATRSVKGVIEIYPKFKIRQSADLMIRGSDFYAIWNERIGFWSTSEQDAIEMIDNELDIFVENNKQKFEGQSIRILHMWDADSGSIDRWHKYCQRQMRDNFHPLDEKLIFSNQEITKEDYASKRLSYPLEEGECPSYEKLISTLYSPAERHKIEWAIGAIVTGDSRNIQKFMVLYGAMGTGKSTILNIVQQLFEGYYSVFKAKDLGSGQNAFALEAFRSNPLVAIEHDGDLSRIEDNTRLNSLVSHEIMMVNEKFKAQYSTRFKTFIFLGTNKPVKITDSRSGLLRRLIDVEPSGMKLPVREYNRAVKQVQFELGAIAWHCREVYLSDTGYYDQYVPVRMLGATNDFYNFLIDAYPVFKKEDGTTLKAAWEMYKTWCEDARVGFPFPLRVFKEELKNYFWEFEERFVVDGSRVRNYYKRFRTDKFQDQMPEEQPTEEPENWIVLSKRKSLFDTFCADCFAQYAGENDIPSKKWSDVTTHLRGIDTSKVHYVKVPMNHIVIDFDIPDANGNKCLEKNLEAASKWPPTYAELSKSGQGIHLHYIYTGDPSKLNRVYDDHVEIKVFSGRSSLRRKLTKCNDIPIRQISSGLPLKGEKAMVNIDRIEDEKHLRALIKKNLNKEIHGNTTCSIDFIAKLLDDAYKSGMPYDVTDMYGAVIAMAANSSNQAERCIKTVSKMHFKSEEASEPTNDQNAPMVFYDVEVFPNLFLVNYKFIQPETNSFEDILKAIHEGRMKPKKRLINPTPKEIEELLRYRLVGFNVRRYDNHMLYACLIGYSVEDIYKLSQSIINKQKGFFSEAYNISYTDVYDFASAGNKKSLKKLEIEMKIHHQELGLPWDKPVPEELWDRVSEYCDNDVDSTEAAFWYLEADWVARQILADIADLTVNDTTNTLTAKIIFEGNKKPQSQFQYRNLALAVTELPAPVNEFLEDACPEMMDWWKNNTDSLLPYFPGYEYSYGKSTYLGQEVGEGGRVYAEPGWHDWDALLDVSSMHPHSTIAECLFGPEFTKRFKEIVDGRVSIKHEAWSEINDILGGKLTKYIKWVEDGKITSKQLANALKTAINSVYGLTAAKFDNPFRDPRNVDNIVAKRGALFMMNLEQEVKKLGFTVAHIKTDSIKIPHATPEIIKFVMDYGKRYGYSFEHEATYERMCLVNDAVYVARYATPEDCEKLYGYIPGDNKKHGGEWTATGKQFQVPYVFKKLFSKEEIEFDDLCETMSVSTALYLRDGEKEPEFIGRVGQFCPIKPNCGGKELLREGTDKEGNVKYSAATGSKGYFWLESETVKGLHKEADIDRSYYDDMVNKAIETISEFGDFEQFVDIDRKPVYSPPNQKEIENCPIWQSRVHEGEWLMRCFTCPYYHTTDSNEDICEHGYNVNCVPF